MNSCFKSIKFDRMTFMIIVMICITGLYIHTVYNTFTTPLNICECKIIKDDLTCSLTYNSLKLILSPHLCSEINRLEYQKCYIVDIDNWSFATADTRIMDSMVDAKIHTASNSFMRNTWFYFGFLILLIYMMDIERGRNNEVLHRSNWIMGLNLLLIIAIFCILLISLTSIH